MTRTTLGRTGIEVSRICLGTMTWGRQTPEDAAHRQIDMSVERGVEFMDTAEMYPVNPVLKETIGDTERVIGNWIGKTGRRDEIVLATKVAGLNGSFVREGKPVTPDTLTEALEGSLQRLRTDYIDLYQLHWPNRGSYHFRQMWTFDPSAQDAAWERDNMAAVMERLKTHVDEGKIRAFGLSNESAWGTMEWLRAAEATGGPRIAAIQNEYSLLCRIYDTDMAEVGAHEDVTLLAFSPLACGLLTGKYQDGAVPEGSRLKVGGGDLGGRVTERVFDTVDAYLELARTHGLDPSQMAIAWCCTRPFPTIPIFGATTEPQLEVALGALDLVLAEDVIDAIDKLHRARPMPY